METFVNLRRIVAAAAVAVTAVALTGLGAPAHAVGGPSLTLVTAGSGTVGVSQSATAVITSTAGIDPTGAVATFAVNGAVAGTSPWVSSGEGWTATYAWAPTVGGANNVTAYWANASSNTAVTYASAVSTQTTTTSASWAQVGTWVPVTVTVTASAGSTSPAGTVTLSGTGGFSQAANLTPVSAGTSTAVTNYFAGTLGTVTLTASYTPSNSSTLSSTSGPDTITVSNSASPVTISVPTTITVGVPTQVTVTSQATRTGWVTVTANGVTIANQTYFSNGTVVIPVTPPAAGAYTITAVVTSPTGVQYTATDTAVASAPTVPDVVSLTVNGYGPLSTTTPFNAANGSVFTLIPSAASGATVTVTESGPCVLNGNVLTIPTGTGSCTLTAKSPGGNGRAAASSAFPVTLMAGTQTSAVNPKASGKYKPKALLVLAPKGAKTNINQGVTWKVSSGSKYCSIVKKNGNVNVKLGSAHGKRCTVKGTSPAVPGQWNAYLIERTYTTK
jgi:hypothetical protein